MEIEKKSLESEEPRKSKEETPPLRFKQTRKQITPKGRCLDGSSYPPTYDFRAVPKIKRGMEKIYFDTIRETTGTLSEMLGQQLIYQAQCASPEILSNVVDLNHSASLNFTASSHFLLAI